MNIRFPLLTGSLLLALAPLTSTAALVTYAGADVATGGGNNDSVDQFRSTSVAKPFDVGTDSIYGSDGYVLYGTDAPGNQGNGSVLPATLLTDPTTMIALPGYISLSDNGQNAVAFGYGYSEIDNPTLASGASVADIESGGALANVTRGTETSVVNLTIGAGVPVTGFRMGVWVGNADLYAGTVRLAQTTGGAGSASFTHPNYGNAALLFFDVAAAVPGDVFTLYLTKAADSAGNDNVLYGGLTFDSIPEPSLLALVGLALPALALRRRR